MKKVSKVKLISNKEFKKLKEEAEKKSLLSLVFELSDLSENYGSSRFNGSDWNISKNFSLMRVIVQNALTDKLRNLIYALGGVEPEEEI